MAEEKHAVPKSPEKIVVKGNHTRRNSTGNLHSSKGGLKITPRYLGASWGSCHDFCKYGVEDSVEKKARNRIPRQNTERSGDGQDQVKDVKLEERKNKLQIKPKALPDSKSLTNEKHQDINKEAQVSAKKVAVSLKRFSLPGNIMDICAEHFPIQRPKPEQIKPSSSSSTTADRSSRRYSHICTSKVVGVLEESPEGGSRNGGQSRIDASKEMKQPKSRKKEDFASPVVSLSCRPSVKREFSAKSGSDKDLKSMSHAKDNGRKAECEKTIDQSIPEKTVYVVERKLQKPTENVIDGNHFSRSLYRSFKENKFDCERNKIHSSGSSPSFENKQLRHSQSGGHATLFHSPRKLRFKQRRVLSDNQNGKADSEPRSLKEVVAIEDFGASKPEPMEAVLKHEDVEGKKCDQNLFNNVIEETASKLVQTRKSKVRALVHAFETVISLQDTKSSAKTNVYRVD